MKKLREDIEFKEYAESLGWRAFQNTPHFPYDFRRGNYDLWLTGRGWCIAELIDNKYENHRYFRYLKDALIS